jgi:hypothetical protein
MASLVRRLLPVSRGGGRKRPRAMMGSPRRMRTAKGRAVLTGPSRRSRHRLFSGMPNANAFGREMVDPLGSTCRPYERNATADKRQTHFCPLSPMRGCFAPGDAAGTHSPRSMVEGAGVRVIMWPVAFGVVPTRGRLAEADFCSNLCSTPREQDRARRSSLLRVDDPDVPATHPPKLGVRAKPSATSRRPDPGEHGFPLCSPGPAPDSRPGSWSWWDVHAARLVQ